MPFSNTEQISPILAEITRLNPRSILDVGCGLGVYGMLCRIHLDLYHDVEFYRKLDGSQPWATRIDGIEGCETYTPFIPRWAYDQVHIGNALDLAPTFAENQYDLVLILAMIEHLTLDQGMQLIDQLKRVSRAIILSVPKHWQEQQIEGYPLETHRSHWTEQQLRDAGFTRFLPHWGAWLAIYGIPPDPEATDNAINADYLASSHQINLINENVVQIQCDISMLLLNQHVIFDRLSISSRFRSLKKRLGNMFSRHCP